MKKLNILALFITIAFFSSLNQSDAQIYEPEGLNMPGAWNTWTNPPTNNLALASYTQVSGGLITKISDGTAARWNTTLHVAASGGDVVEGNYNWLFTSGPTGSPWNNKWSGVNVVMNTLQLYLKENPTDNNITLTNDRWYTVNWEDNSYTDTRAIFMETSAAPVAIATVSEPTTAMPNTSVGVDITLSGNPCPEEVFYIRYTSNNWASSDVVLVNISGTSGTAAIPGHPANTQVDYYAFSSTVSGITADFDLQTIKLNNNSGSNYSYSIGDPPPPSVGWCNLQWPATGDIEDTQSFVVYGQIYLLGVTDGAGQGAGIQAWIGYSTTDSDPTTWVNWVPATFNTDVGNNDEYMADLGAAIGEAGTYYYAYRYQYLDQSYVYGGFQSGFWDGTSNVSGVLNIIHIIPLSNWAFLLFGLFALSFALFKFRK